jgi:hypothetical protein
VERGRCCTDGGLWVGGGSQTHLVDLLKAELRPLPCDSLSCGRSGRRTSVLSGLTMATPTCVVTLLMVSSLRIFSMQRPALNLHFEKMSYINIEVNLPMGLIFFVR